MTRAAAALLAAALGALAAPGEAAEPAPKERIALERLRADGISAALVEAIEERICTAIAEVAGVETSCPADVAAAAMLARLAATLGECPTDECLRRVDAARAADRRVTGALERGEKGLVLSLQLAGPAGAGPRFVERLPEDLDALVSRVPDVVRKLFQQ